jgi:hypothetical protein
MNAHKRKLQGHSSFLIVTILSCLGESEHLCVLSTVPVLLRRQLEEVALLPACRFPNFPDSL